ncbi:RNA-binding domain-containing protein [Proteiniphilum sp.]|uniref:RNA-binding domain-containing protein n=1 Tax=Proteiniphilum sp. TaxID=1926877 RepID=UPI00332C9990
MPLPININELLTGRVIEWDRLEFKKGWNPEEVIHTICAFANDINNWGGGYIVIGVDEKDGQPSFPPAGLQENQIDHMQKELVELSHKIAPHYIPVTAPVVYQDRLIFIIWVPGGDERPYKVPQTLSKGSPKRVYIRQGSVSKPASKEEERFLNTISIALPFDDRINHQASVDELDKDLLVEFLYEVGSDLHSEAANIGKEELALQMQLLKGPKEYLRPVNAALLFFNREPHKFFRGAVSEVVLYKDYDGIQFTENIFRGALFKQIKNVLEYLRNIVLTEKVIKIPGQAEALRIWNYPYEAVEEIVANAYYHRSYEIPDPIEISVYPDKLVVLSFPGPLPPVDKEALKQRKIFSRSYRNRRIGDFLKELDLTEGRGTGFPIIYRKMEQNGSPQPSFETDDIHTHFLAVLPVHPEFLKEEELLPLESPKALEILNLCRQAKSRKEIMDMLQVSNQTKNHNRYITPLVELNLLLLTTPNKPNSSKQQYMTSEVGLTYLSK